MRQLTLVVFSMLFIMLNTPTLGQQTVTDWLNEGQKLVDQGRYTEAIQAYDKGIELSPQFTDLYYHKGTALNKLDKPDEAIQAFDKVNEVNPKDGVVAYYWIGRTLSGAGRYDEAIQAYGKSTQSFNTYGEWFPGQKSICAQAWYYEGLALDAVGRSDEAQNAYDSAIKLNPSITRPNKAIPGNKVLTNSSINATNASSTNENTASAWISKGDSLNLQDKYDEAILAYDRAIELDPQNVDAWYDKGLALSALGRTTEATEAFARAAKAQGNTS